MMKLRAKKKSKPVVFLLTGFIAISIPFFTIAQSADIFEPIQNRWGALLQIVRPIFIFADIALVALIVMIIVRYSKMLGAHSDTPIEPAPPLHIVSPRAEVTKSWEHIRSLINSSHASDWNMAVLRADALFDDILAHSGYAGDGLGERLRIIDPTRLPSLERIWSAHRLRNAIAHDPMEQHTKETILHALRSFEQGLKELEVLDDKPIP